MGDSIYADIVEALQEIEEYQNGNAQLRADVVEIPDALRAGSADKEPKQVAAAKAG